MNYRFFRVNAAGVIDNAQVISLAGNDDAFVHARGFGNGQAVEIWLESRKIATVLPGGAPIMAIAA